MDFKKRSFNRKMLIKNNILNNGLNKFGVGDVIFKGGNYGRKLYKVCQVYNDSVCLLEKMDTIIHPKEIVVVDNGFMALPLKREIIIGKCLINLK